MRVLFFDKQTEQFIPYDKGQHLQQVSRVNLYSELSVILTAPPYSGFSIIYHRNLNSLGRKLGILAKICPPDGACVLSRGKVYSWESSGYFLTTPEGPLRDTIIRELGIEKPTE